MALDQWPKYNLRCRNIGNGRVEVYERRDRLGEGMCVSLYVDDVEVITIISAADEEAFRYAWANWTASFSSLQKVSLLIGASRPQRIKKLLAADDKSSVQAKLRLLPNCLKSLSESLVGIDAEIVVADWHSDDWPLQEWAHGAAAPVNVRIVSVEGTFSRGCGRNVAAAASRGEELLFLDADMVVTHKFVKRAIKIARWGCAFFPVCWSFTNPSHSRGRWRPTGKGNCLLTRTVFYNAGGWPDLPTWGDEDGMFLKAVRKVKRVVRRRDRGLRHQWHPNDQSWKNRYCMDGVALDHSEAAGSGSILLPGSVAAPAEPDTTCQQVRPLP